MPENRNLPQRNSREQLFEWQVKVLADRLAIAISRLEDAELDCFCEGQAEGVTWFETAQGLLLLNNEAWRSERQKVRKSNLYQGALTKVRKMLDRRIRDMRRAS